MNFRNSSVYLLQGRYSSSFYQDVPDIYNKLKDVSRKQDELNRLQRVHSLNIAETNMEKSLLSCDYKSLHKQLCQLRVEARSELVSISTKKKEVR